MKQHIRIIAFGITKDILGSREMTLEANTANTVRALRKTLEEKYPKLKNLKSLFIAVNQAYAEEDTLISPNDEVALIPPVSGG